MSKGNGFFSNLKKSTKITLVSCGCFIALSAAILFFFVMFPITPSEKVISSFGRESIYKKDVTGTTVTSTAVTTSNNDIIVAKSSKTTTTSARTTRTEMPKITSGSGFYTGQKIPSGGTPGENYYTPTFQTTTTSAAGGYSNGEYPISSTPNGSGTGTVTTPVSGGEVTPPVEGGGTEVTPPVEGGSGGGGESPAPVEGGGGSETPAPVEGGGAAPAAE